MSFELYQEVILNEDLPAHGLRAGDVGTVVDRHLKAEIEDGWSVEFFNMIGGTVAVACVPGRCLRSPTSADRPSARLAAVTD